MIVLVFMISNTIILFLPEITHLHIQYTLMNGWSAGITNVYAVHPRISLIVSNSLGH